MSAFPQTIPKLMVSTPQSQTSGPNILTIDIEPQNPKIYQNGK